MNIKFQIKNGDSGLGIKFFWKMEIKTRSPVALTEHFIPELFFDYFHLQVGEMHTLDYVSGRKRKLPSQLLKSIFTQPFGLLYSTPVLLFGARLSLGFAETFSEAGLYPNSLQAINWVAGKFNSLDVFARAVTDFLENHRKQRSPYPMFKALLEESDWLVHYSARHKRRLYHDVFGLSRKELQNIHNLHTFLAQACDFGAQNPRIIKHVNPDVYYDQPHLNHAFKKLTGLSPVEYFEANSILQDNLMSASYNEDQAS